MKKTFIMAAVGAGTAAAAVIGALILRTPNKNQQTVTDTLKEAGMPGQLNQQDTAQQENAEMVSEGSQFGVQYFNNADNMSEET